MPITITIPQHTRTVCRGCPHLKVSAGIRGRFKCTDNYNCQHPGVEFGSSIFGRGRSIAFNSETEPDTPEWCPLLNEKSK